MNRFLLLALTAGLLSPIAANAEDEFTELTPINPYSYKKSSLVRWVEEGNRYISFKGSTKIPTCFGGENSSFCIDRNWNKAINSGHVELREDGLKVWIYEIGCTNKKYNRIGDNRDWMKLISDPTAELVSNKYCPINSWNKLPIDPTK